MYGYIYKTTNIINKKIYIGQKRAAEFLGVKYLGSGKYLANAIEKYGKNNFIVEKIDEANDKNELNEKEKYWIKFYNSTDNSIGYNISLGGDGGDTWSNLKKDDKEKRLQKRQDTVFKNFGKGSPNKGRKWLIGPDGEHIVVEPEDVEYYEKLGFKKHSPSLGRIVSSETKMKQSESACERIKNHGAPNAGKILVYNNNLNKHKFILPDEFEKYKQEGWEKGQSIKNRKKFSEETIEKMKTSHLGQLPNTKGKIKINNGTMAKYIQKSELEYYLSIGWEKGALPFTEEHRKNLSKGNKNNPNIFNFKGYKYINNGTEEKRVSPLELEQYFSCGWKLGRINNSFSKCQK